MAKALISDQQYYANLIEHLNSLIDDTEDTKVRSYLNMARRRCELLRAKEN